MAILLKRLRSRFSVTKNDLKAMEKTLGFLSEFSSWSMDPEGNKIVESIQALMAKYDIAVEPPQKPPEPKLAGPLFPEDRKPEPPFAEQPLPADAATDEAPFSVPDEVAEDIGKRSGEIDTNSSMSKAWPQKSNNPTKA